GFLSATTAAVTVDQGLNVVKLADEMRGISMNEVTFTTVPIANANYTTPTGQSAVQWDAAAASALFGGLKNDSVATAPRPAARPKLRRSQVSVDIYNGTMIGGLSAGTGTQLAALGFRVHGSGLTWSSLDLTQTVIEYPAGRKAAGSRGSGSCSARLATRCSRRRQRRAARQAAPSRRPPRKTPADS